MLILWVGKYYKQLCLYKIQEREEKPVNLFAEMKQINVHPIVHYNTNTMHLFREY